MISSVRYNFSDKLEAGFVGEAVRWILLCNRIYRLIKDRCRVGDWLQVLTPSSGFLDFAISMRPDYHRAIIDTVRHYGWKKIIYLYDSHDGKWAWLVCISHSLLDGAAVAAAAVGLFLFWSPGYHLLEDRASAYNLEYTRASLNR